MAAGTSPFSFVSIWIDSFFLKDGHNDQTKPNETKRWSVDRIEPGQNGSPQQDPEGLITVKEVCELLSMKPSWVYDVAWKGDLPSYRMGRAVRFRRSDVIAFVEARRGSAVAR